MSRSVGTPVSVVLEQVRRHALGSRRAEFNWLNGDITTTQTTVTVLDPPGGITPKSYIGIEGELLYVRSVSGQVATVRRGMLGTTATAHATDTDVEVNPRFPRGVILDHLKDEIDSWGPTLFQVPAALSVTVASPFTRGYGLNLGTFYDVLQVRRAPMQTAAISGSGVWPELRKWRIDRLADPSSFPTGVALYLTESLPTAVNLKVIYSKPFVTSVFTEATDLIAVIGLEASYLDMLRYGALWRLMSGTEVIRTDTHAQGEPREAAEVPPGHRLNTAKGFKALRDQRLAEESMRLVRRWGMAAAG